MSQGERPTAAASAPASATQAVTPAASSVPPTPPNAPAAAPAAAPTAPSNQAAHATGAASTGRSVAAPAPRIRSVAEAETKLRTPNDLPDAASVETSSQAGDPLYTQAIEAGLEQLLLEWELFAKSGFFGTGPKGKAHPLFKKLAGLQIPLVLAGRFEGATQEIRQNITDTMNGWRYQQGIIYQQGETFEHYLRRVVRHILDLQNEQ